MWKRGKALSIASITSKKDLRERMVTRTPSKLVVLVCAETFTELSVLVIGMYLSFEFQFGFRVAFRLARKRLPIASIFVIGTWMGASAIKSGTCVPGSVFRRIWESSIRFVCGNPRVNRLIWRA